MFGGQDNDVQITQDPDVTTTTDANAPGTTTAPNVPVAPTTTDDAAAVMNEADMLRSEASTPTAPASPADDPDLLSDTDTANDDLLQIKQQALQQLSPLVDHLDQTPEEKFRTTMMMIQASDNQALIKDAYTAAQNIPDEKTRAQALLDIINEINYFTQQSA